MVAKAKLVTAAELLAMPEDGYRYELVRGELRKMAPASAEHGEVAFNVIISLGNYVKANNLGKVYPTETGFWIEADPDHVRAPDVAFVRRERAVAAGRFAGYWPGHPDMAVEVISPNDRYTEVNAKVADWLAAGVQLVVVVNPRWRVVTCHRPGQSPVTLTEDDILEGYDVVPGWQMLVRDIFA